MSIVLGFDISSATIGYCILSIDDLTNDIKYISMDYFKPIKTGSIMERIVNTRDKLSNIINSIKPDYIAIEDLIKFMPKSTASTVVVLTTFNRMTCLCAFDYLKKHPELLNVMTIRHGLKFGKVLPKKEEMPEVISKHLNIKFPYIYNKKNKIKPESNDMADAAAVALYYALKLTNKIKKKIKKKK